jgi:ubiquinone/menaquinone biosynthesis C-methylase UbiE
VNRAAKFWDRVADRYSRRSISDEASYEEKLRITAEYLRPEMRLLEFGCGTGSTALIHAPSVRQIHAIDVSKNMIRIARAKAGAMDIRNVTFACTAIEDLELRDESFDGVLGLNILHLLGNWREVLIQVNRLLKPGGVFVSSTFCIGDSMSFLRWIIPIGTFIGLLPAIRVFKQADLEKGMQDAGFEIEHHWKPGKNKAVFLVARKPANHTASPTG